MFILVRRANLRRGFCLLAAALLLLTALGLHTRGRAFPVVAEPVYHGDPDVKTIALTCNVFWGEEYVGPMLEILTEKEVRMTFFIGGTWAEKFPEYVREIQWRGHEIGSHGYSHPHPDKISREANAREIIKAQEILLGITGEKPVLFAPPYGERGTAVLQAADDLGYYTILWSIDTVDWQRPEPEVISKRVMSKAHNGGIILMHPTAPTVQALPGIIDVLRQQGYRLVTVGEMLKIMKKEN